MTVYWSIQADVLIKRVLQIHPDIHLLQLVGTGRIVKLFAPNFTNPQIFMQSAQLRDCIFVVYSKHFVLPERSAMQLANSTYQLFAQIQELFS